MLDRYCAWRYCNSFVSYKIFVKLFFCITFYKMLNDCFKIVVNHQNNLDVTEINLEVMTSCFRELRDKCASDGQEFQNTIVSQPHFIESCFGILDKFNEGIYVNNKEMMTCFQVGIQFIGNLIVANDNTKAFLWLNYANELKKWCCSRNFTVRKYSEMVIYNLMVDIFEVKEFIVNNTDLIEQLIIDSIHECEFAYFITEQLIASKLKAIYFKISINFRLNVLKILRKCVLENRISLTQESIHFLALTCHSVTGKIICKKSELTYIEAQESNGLLYVICMLTSNACYKSYLERETAFIEFVLECLCRIHSLGLGSENVFTPVLRLTEIGSAELPNHPLFGIKALLIRLIGNLSYHNLLIQEKVRFMNVLPVILDCTKFDAKNPYITQWSILAIANLCEQNEANKRYIKSMPMYDPSFDFANLSLKDN